MPLTFPLGSSAFWRLFSPAIESFQWSLGDTRRVTRTVGGEILVAEGAARLWQGSVVLPVMTQDAARRVQALLSVLTSGQGTFFAHDVRRNFPLLDPEGVTLGGFLPVIHALNVNGLEMRVANLPAGYVLSPGDMLGFSYGSPVKYALHRVVTTGTASGAGITDEFQVEPAIRPGAAVGSAVRLNRASIVAVIDPDSVREGAGNQLNQSGIGFSFMQSLRG